MLHFGRALRAVMVLLAFGVALQGAMPLASRVCAMHATGHESANTMATRADDATAPPAAAASSAEHVHHVTAAHAPDAPGSTAVGAPAHAPANAPANAPAHPCDCDTDCCGLPTLALSLAVATSAAATRATVARAPLNPAPPRAEAAPRLLPFANGPPPHVPG